MKIILASQSPRRNDILNAAGISFNAVNHMFDEKSVGFTSPAEYVKKCAIGKARSILNSYTKSMIIGSDTIVYLNGEIIGKPESREDAERMLNLLSGKTHYVYSGIAIIYEGKEYIDYVKTAVSFHKLDNQEINEYLNNAQYMDKAGAYAIQDKASIFIEKIKGDYFNIVGFPLTSLREMIYNITGKKYYEIIYRKNRN